MHVWISKLAITGSGNALSPGWRQAIIWTNAGILLNGPLGTNFNEISIKIHTFSFKKKHLETASAKWQQFLSRPQCVNSYRPDDMGWPWTKSSLLNWHQAINKTKATILLIRSCGVIFKCSGLEKDEMFPEKDASPDQNCKKFKHCFMKKYRKIIGSYQKLVVSSLSL